MDMGDMDMGGGSDPTMTTFLHFVPFTDAVWFREWTPSSHGALVGACIGLFILGIVDRLLAGMRGVLDTYWRRKTDAILYRKHCSPMKSGLRAEHSDMDNKRASLESGDSAASVPTTPTLRFLPPFILNYEFSRAAFRTLQSFFGFAIMLAVMSFNAAFIISILIGIFAGELLFGRFASLGEHHV